MNGSLGALLQEALADEERRLELLEARLASLREQQQAAPAPAPSASDSTQAIWAALAVGPGRAPTASVTPAPTAAPPEEEATQGEEAAADAEDWAALAAPEREPSEPSATAYAAAAAAVEDAPAVATELDPRLEAARRLLLQSGQGLQELKTVLARVPGWDDASPATDEPTDEREERDGEFWSPPSAPVGDGDDDDHAPPEVPARDRPTRTRPSDAAAFGLERAFRGEAPAQASGGEPGWARDLRERQERGLEVLGRVEELLLELGKTIATVLEAKSGQARGDAALEARAERAERECEALRRAVAERAARIARLEALVEQVMVSPATPPAPTPALTPRGTRRAPSPGPGPGPSEALRRTLLGSPAQSTEASRRALAALGPIADEGDRARLRQSLAALGAQHAQLLDRLVRLLES